MPLHWTREENEKLADEMLDATIERNIKMIKFLENRPELACRELADKLRLLVEFKKQVN